MKRLKICLSVLLFISFTGCDYLKYDETQNFKKEDVFSDFDRTRKFLNNIYNRIPSGFNSVDGAMRASATDNAEEVFELAKVQEFNDGSWSAINTIDANWGAMYTGIRAANRFLKEFNIENFEDREHNFDYDQLVKQAKLYPYQARFLRAFFYFELIKRYGGVPLITKVLTREEANKVEPSTFEEVVDFIVSEVNAIAPELPVSYKSIPKDETGRATRGAALALKSRVLLYAASPLHNESGDRQKWIDAAEAAKKVIDMNAYSLALFYQNIFNDRNNNELIFGRRQGRSNNFERSNFPVGYEGANPGTAPTQNLVDAYEMKTTGKGIDEPGSGYDPSKPYQNRDPRLRHTIILNNSEWKGRNVEIWNGGLDGPPKDLATTTGYYLKKHVIEDVSLEPNNTTEIVHTWVIFRYAEILLNYAEAMNEAYGPDNPADMGMSAREAVNQVRSRQNVSMPPFPAGMSKQEFREKLHNERRVELAFEDHRFWDLRRWKIGPSTTDINGMIINRKDDGSFTYRRKDVEERVWKDRMYLYPIPQSELFKNDALEQNPGW